VAEELVHLPPESTLDNVHQPIDLMIDEVAGLIGGHTDPAVRAKAQFALDRAADWMNMSGIYMFRRKTETYDSLTADQATLDVPSDWGWPERNPRVFDSSDNPNTHMEWLDWDQFRTRQNATDNSGTPCIISARNELETTFAIHPGVDLGEVNSIELDYYARVQRPSEHEEILILPEIREALICGGEAFAVRFRHLTRPRIWEPLWVQFTKAIKLAKGVTWRYRQAVLAQATPVETGHPLMDPYSSTGRGTAYIRI
jgi:hypothetical protein